MSRKKVFCIGFQKTGTTSLAKALRILGYSVTGPNGVKDTDVENNVRRMVFPLVEKYDAFQDNPWPILYKELDEKFPGSLFILTLRDENKWIKSVVEHFRDKDTSLFRWIYGVGNPAANAEVYLNRYKQHNQEVLEYFKDRTDDFMIFELSKNDGWERLCSFLQCDIPEEPFPHENKASDREIRRKSLKGLTKRLKKFSGYYFVRDSIKSRLFKAKWDK